MSANIHLMLASACVDASKLQRQARAALAL